MKSDVLPFNTVTQDVRVIFTVKTFQMLDITKNSRLSDTCKEE